MVGDVVVTIIYVAAVDIVVAVCNSVSAVDIGGAKVGKLGVFGHDSLSKMSIVLRNDREL